MDDLVTRLVGLTEQFVGGIEHTSSEAVLQFIEQRDEIVQEMSSGGGVLLTEEQKLTIQSLLKWDSLILNRMNQLKSEASRELQKIRQSKLQHDVYDKAYALNSYFFDKKK